MIGWLTVAEAAKRVGRSERTIYRWAEKHLVKVHTNGMIDERKLLAADEAQRSRRGRPKKEVVSDS